MDRIKYVDLSSGEHSSKLQCRHCLPNRYKSHRACWLLQNELRYLDVFSKDFRPESNCTRPLDRQISGYKVQEEDVTKNSGRTPNGTVTTGGVIFFSDSVGSNDDSRARMNPRCGRAWDRLKQTEWHAVACSFA